MLIKRDKVYNKYITTSEIIATTPADILLYNAAHMLIAWCDNLRNTCAHNNMDMLNAYDKQHMIHVKQRCTSIDKRHP